MHLILHTLSWPRGYNTTRKRSHRAPGSLGPWHRGYFTRRPLCQGRTAIHAGVTGTRCVLFRTMYTCAMYTCAILAAAPATAAAAAVAAAAVAAVAAAAPAAAAAIAAAPAAAAAVVLLLLLPPPQPPLPSPACAMLHAMLHAMLYAQALGALGSSGSCVARMWVRAQGKGRVLLAGSLGPIALVLTCTAESMMTNLMRESSS